GATRLRGNRAWKRRSSAPRPEKSLCITIRSPAFLPHVGRKHGCTLHRVADGLLRAGFHTGQAVLRYRSESGDLVQPASQDLRLAPQAAVLLREGRDPGFARGNDEGLRVPE